MRIEPPWHPDGLPPGYLTREVLPPCPRRHVLTLFGRRITIGICVIAVGGCMLGALAQRLGRADRAAEARIEVRCGR